MVGVLNIEAVVLLPGAANAKPGLVVAVVAPKLKPTG